MERDLTEPTWLIWESSILLSQNVGRCLTNWRGAIGIVLGAKKDELLMEYALQGITNQLFAARYQLYLPKREELQEQLDKLLEGFEP